MENRRHSQIITIGGEQFFVILRERPISERYSFEEWKNGQEKLREMGEASETSCLTPEDEAALKKYGI